MAGETQARRSEVRDGMRIDWDVPISVSDGLVLRADLFRPPQDGPLPVILSYGAFGKGLAFQDGYASAWAQMTEAFPEVARGSSNLYQNWEVVDPEKWVPDGYAVLRIDARGAGRSPGFLDPWSRREAQDIYDAIEWAAAQPWCSGKVGMNGISYFAMNQWFVASLQPPHLAAICVWEGAADFYRDVSRHGGIYSQFMDNLFPRAFHRAQHGLGERGLRSRATGEPISGPETLSDDTLARNRVDIERFVLDHPLDDAAHHERSAQWENITVPFLSAANWGGQGLHTRGNFEGFMRAASDRKWLEAHGEAHWVHFYTDYGVALQKRFFGHFLKGEDTGWSRQPPVQLQVRHVDRFALRHEDAWPIPRTQWTKFFLAPDGGLGPEPPAGEGKLAYETTGEGLLFSTGPLETEIEITGPVAAKLFLSSDTQDADVFLVLRVFDRNDDEVVFYGSNDPRTPVGIGWLRASHRKLDPTLTRPYRPYHSHDETWPLTPGEAVELHVEIWPTSIVVPEGYRLALSVRGKDYESRAPAREGSSDKYTLTGVGPFRHQHALDRPSAVFGGVNTLHFAPGRMPYVLLPIIPPNT